MATIRLSLDTDQTSFSRTVNLKTTAAINFGDDMPMVHREKYTRYLNEFAYELETVHNTGYDYGYVKYNVKLVEQAPKARNDKAQANLGKARNEARAAEKAVKQDALPPLSFIDVVVGSDVLKSDEQAVRIKEKIRKVLDLPDSQRIIVHDDTMKISSVISNEDA